MSFEFVLYDKVNRVATITMNRPEKLNAINIGMRRDLSLALDEAERDADVRCVLLTGAGRAFSSGADQRWKEGDESAGPPRETVLDWLEASTGRGELPGDRIREFKKPVIGVINGLCYGAGLITATYTDFRIASDQAKFCFIESRHGGSGSPNSPLLIGADWTKRLMFTGEIIDAQRALQIGLVTEVIPHEQLMPKAQELGERIAAMPPKGVRFNKMAINGAMHAMGLDMMRSYQTVVSAIGNSLISEATAPDGRRLRDILENEGLKEFLRVRNEFFDRPWP